MSAAGGPASQRVRRLTTHLLAAATPTGAETGAVVAVVAGGGGGGAPELVPLGWECALLRSQWARKHLRWMGRKDLLAQDMYLLGVYGPSIPPPPRV